MVNSPWVCYLQRGLFGTPFFISSSWGINCQEQYWFSKRLEMGMKTMPLCVYFQPADHRRWSFFQRQVKDICKEMGDCLLGRESVETLPGAPVVMGLLCDLLGTLDGLKLFLLSKKKKKSHTMSMVLPCFSHGREGSISGQSHNNSAPKRLCKPAFTRRNRRSPKVRMLVLLTWFFFSSPKGL